MKKGKLALWINKQPNWIRIILFPFSLILFMLPIFLPVLLHFIGFKQYGGYLLGYAVCFISFYWIFPLFIIEE